MGRDRRKLEAFARELALGKTAYEAALAAGYPDGPSTKSNASTRACRPDVKQLVADLLAPAKAKAAEKLEITLDLLIERANEIYRRALAAGQFNAASGALKELGVLTGKRVERSERGEPGEFDRMSDAELREAVIEKARALGFAPPDETKH